MLPEITIRSHSTDQFLADKVLYSNSYRLKKFLPNSCVVDIGANVGFFSLSCCLQGAEKIYAFEPANDSYQLLSKNLTSFSNDNHQLFKLGVNTTSGFFKINKPTLINNAFYDCSEVGIAEEGETCYFIKLDEILKMVKEDIYLLKISAPGKELEIINSSSLLNRVENLCFELKCHGSEYADIEKSIKAKWAFSDSSARKISESNFLFLFSKTKCSICFSNYDN